MNIIRGLMHTMNEYLIIIPQFIFQLDDQNIEFVPEVRIFLQEQSRVVIQQCLVTLRLRVNYLDNVTHAETCKLVRVLAKNN